MFEIELRRLGRIDFLGLAGHLMALLAITGLIISPAVGPALIVTGILSLAYLGLTWRTGKAGYLYPASLFLTSAYLIAISQVGLLDAWLLWVLPLQLVFFGLAIVLRRRGRTEYAYPLEVSGHLAAFYLATVCYLFNQSLSVPILIVADLGLLMGIDLGLAWINRERWFLFPAALNLSLAYLFILLFAPGGAPLEMTSYFALGAVIYALLSWWLRRTRSDAIAEPIEAAAFTVAIVSGAAAISDGTLPGLHGLVVASIASGLLFASVRSEKYIYLVILAAGGIGFQFLRIAGQRFSNRLVDQFLVGLVIVSILYFYPTLRRLTNGNGQVHSWFAEGGWGRVLVVGLPLIILAVSIGVNYTFQATANPTFCGSCHIMQPQYEAWNRGSHRDITCDTCHYPPGLDLFVQGKIVGLMEVANNAAGTIGTKPHGNVDNANCEKCHTVNALIGVSSPYRTTIKFDHTELEAGKDSGITMRCNNCHAHIEDGYHFQVRESTCYWCHFMGRQGQAPVIGTCFTCHDVPKDYTHIGVIASKNENDCTVSGCHSNVTVGDGAVRLERCLTCHGRIDPRATQAQAMHDLHIVSRTTFLSRKVECLECHDEITHGKETFDMNIVPIFGP
jgi:nitrate/TMAO reductase-like tetraheme cytochrome c subunit